MTRRKRRSAKRRPRRSWDDPTLYDPAMIAARQQWAMEDGRAPRRRFA